MIKSMTGYGGAEGAVGGAMVSVEIRSVNHRFFNPSVKLPLELGKWEGEVRDALRQRVARGHVTLSARIERAQAGPVQIDEARFATYVEQIRALQARFGLSADLDAGTILRLPDVIAAAQEESTATATELVAIVERAAEAMDRMRAAEGARLAAYIEERIAAIESAVERIAARAPDRVIEQRDRLRDAVRELAEGIALDEQRVAQEIAVLADRLDVSEEISRFHSHIAEFRSTLLGASGSGVGKRLGFLLQELLREANTTGSKGNDATMLQDVILVKEELERIREQVENLE
jgi:uncharacterized protein (TIGR00255 family)